MSSRWTAAVVCSALVLSCWQEHVAAQTPAPSAEPSPSPSGAVDAQYAQAQRVVARGEALFDLGNYDAARSEFQQAYQLLAGHPRRYIVLHNLALCDERMFHYDDALAYYERYLKEGGPEAEDRGQIEAVVSTLRGLLGAVRVSSNVRAELWIDDRRLGDAPGTRLVPAGRHVVELRAPLYESVRREVDVHARGEQPLRFELQRLSKYEGPNPAFFWTSAGLTVAAAGTGAVLGIAALNADSQGKAQQKKELAILADEQHVQRLALAADIAFASAAVLAATTTVLFFVTDFDADAHERAPAPGARAELRVAPWLARGNAGISVQGALQ